MLGAPEPSVPTVVGVCTTRSHLGACHRRVGPSCSAIPPPFGGVEAVSGADVVPKTQTTSAKNAENGPLRARWCAFWAKRCWSGCACTPRSGQLGPTDGGNPSMRGYTHLVVAGHAPTGPSNPPRQRKALTKGERLPVKVVTSLDNGRKWRVYAGRTLELLR